MGPAYKYLKSNDVPGRSKHYEVRLYRCREEIKKDTYEAEWIPRDDMTADYFTHPVSVLENIRRLKEIGLYKNTVKFTKNTD